MASAMCFTGLLEEVIFLHKTNGHLDVECTCQVLTERGKSVPQLVVNRVISEC